MKNKPEIKTVLGPLPRFLKMRRVAVYARISKLNEATATSIDTQISGLLSFAWERPLLQVKGIYVDIGTGRSKESRIQLNRLLDDCMAGEYDLIITKSISRFARNTIDVLSICRKLKEKDIGVYFVSENIYSLSSSGEFTLTLYSEVAEMDSRNKSENIKWGIDKSVRKVECGIYSRPCYGYMRDGKGGLMINEEEASVVKMIFDLYLQGHGSSYIQNELSKKRIRSPHGGKVWPRNTIEKLLRNEKYTGDVIVYKTFTADFPSRKRIVNNELRGKFMNKGHHEPIISQKVFDKVQDEIARRGRNKMK